MRKTSILAAVVLSTFAGATACWDEDDLLDVDVVVDAAANLTADQVVPIAPVGPPTATGVALLNFNNGILTVTVDIVGDLTSGATSVTVNGPAGVGQTGPILLDLTSALVVVVGPGPVTGTIATAAIDLRSLAIDPAGIRRTDTANLFNFISSGRAYVQVNTVLNPGGELRGQLFRN